MRWITLLAFLALAPSVRPAAAQLPDLTVEAFDVELEQGASVDADDVVEGCAGAASGRTLLRFALRTGNAGAADVVLGDPGCPDCSAFPGAACANPLYVCSTAHGHAHFNGYAKSELIAPDGTVAATGRKIGFCVFDLECPDGTPPKYSCDYQGLTAGCADVYLAELPCQYMDLTGVPLSPGGYRLRVTVDPDGMIAEADEGNNAFEVPFTLDCEGGRDVLATCTPNPFLCYATGVRDQPERRLTTPVDVDATGTFGDLPLTVTRPRELCTPAGAGTDARKDAVTHLRAYAARPRDGGGAVTAPVRIVTQLGERRLEVGRLESYAEPAAVAIDAEPAPLDPTRHTVDRFACFKVKVPRADRQKYRPTTLTVGGEFIDPPALLSVKKPRRLCTPVATAGEAVQTPKRHLLCHDLGRAPSARTRAQAIDTLGTRTVKLGRPSEVCLLAAKNPPAVLAEELVPCAAADTWQFQARAGQTVEVSLDTTDPATAADLCADLTCGDLMVPGDDEAACTFPPPSFACPRITAVPTTDGLCTVRVRTCSACASNVRADYALTVAVAGEEASPTLVTDDEPVAP
jgi:hypothetical protein